MNVHGMEVTPGGQQCLSYVHTARESCPVQTDVLLLGRDAGVREALSRAVSVQATCWGCHTHSPLPHIREPRCSTGASQTSVCPDSCGVSPICPLQKKLQLLPPSPSGLLSVGRRQTAGRAESSRPARVTTNATWVQVSATTTCLLGPLTLSRMLMSEPLASSSFTRSTCLYSVAQIMGVQPPSSWFRETEPQKHLSTGGRELHAQQLHPCTLPTARLDRPRAHAPPLHTAHAKAGSGRWVRSADFKAEESQGGPRTSGPQHPNTLSHRASVS